MSAGYLARTATGDPLLGDESGCVPLDAAAPGVASVADALELVPGGLPDPSTATADPVPAEALSLGPAVEPAGKLLGIGLNYADHAADLDESPPDEPASFLQPATAATGPGGPIRLPPPDVTDRVTAEAELAVVVGRTCRDVAVEEVDDVVAGYLPVIDVTAEDVLQRNPRFLTRAKSFDTFLVLGPRLALPGGVTLDDVEVRTIVDGEVIARNVVANMHAPPRELVAFHSRSTTLEPGDLISTGTPGAGVVAPDDRVRAEVEGVGAVTADVVR